MEQKQYRLALLILPISAAVGLIFGIVLNTFFDKITTSIWTPAAIMICFAFFATVITLFVFTASKILKSHSTPYHFARQFIAIIAIFLVSTLVLEFIYELGLSPSSTQFDSYIFVIDDSGSMEGNDPNNLRIDAIDDLMKDKDEDFCYSVYTFADEFEQKRAMLPKSETTPEPEVLSDGGTAMYGALEGVLRDIKSGNLKVKNGTRMILLSDGYAQDIGAFQYKLKSVLKGYVENNVSICTVGLGNGVNDALMQQIANYTGGVYVNAEDAFQLTSSMVSASVMSAKRNLLSTRGYCKTNVLHAIMRVLFLAIIGMLISSMKWFVFGRRFKPFTIVSTIGVALAALGAEILTENVFLNINYVRCFVFIMLSLTLIDALIRSERFRKRDIEAPPTEPDRGELDNIKGLGQENRIKDSQTKSLD